MSELPGSSSSGAANQTVVADVPNQEIIKLPSEKEDKKNKTYKIAGIVLAVLIVGVVVALIFSKNSQDTRKAASTCTEQCPGNDGVLRNCHPPESDGSAAESTCAWAGRIESCGGRNYCCPSAGGTWTTTMTACATQTPTSTPTATPSATITLSPTATPSATITISPTATPSTTITASPTVTITVSPTTTKTPTPTATPTPTPTKTPTPTNTPTVTATPTPTKTPTPTISSNTLPQSGSVETTFLLMIASLFSIALGVAIKYKN